MPTVKNITTGQSAQCNEGDKFQDVSDTNGLGIPFGCASGMCGTCLVQIKSGQDKLTPVTEVEEFTLESHPFADENSRLACQCQINGDVEFEQP